MTTRKASCSCGELTLVAQGEPVRVSVCHCLDCQRRTGSPFAAQARFPRASVEIAGERTNWTRTADSGNRATFSFCPRCGATVFYVLEIQPDLVAVPIGAFADPTFPAPRISVYEVRRHPWVEVTGTIEQYD